MNGAADYVLRRLDPIYQNEENGRRAARIERAWAEWNGQRFEARSKSSAVMELARRLVAAGAPDGPWQSVTAAGTPSTSGPSLRRLAGLTVAETDKGIRFVAYREPPFRAGRGAAMADVSAGGPDRPETPERITKAGVFEAGASTQLREAA